MSQVNFNHPSQPAHARRAKPGQVRPSRAPSGQAPPSQVKPRLNPPSEARSTQPKSRAMCIQAQPSQAVLSRCKACPIQPDEPQGWASQAGSAKLSQVQPSPPAVCQTNGPIHAGQVQLCPSLAQSPDASSLTTSIQDQLSRPSSAEPS